METSPLSLEARRLPDPGPGEVRLRVLACGVCHTDLHVVEGEIPWRGPVVPGHQVVGVVEALGAGVDAKRQGERGAVSWLHWACGDCAFCRRGDENLCPRALFTGYTAGGGFADAILAPASYVIPVPPDLEDARAAPLLCAGAVGFRALRLAAPAPGDRLGLFGFGASAHLVLQVARARGVVCAVFTRGDAHRELARSLGAELAGSAAEYPGEPLDRAILFAPAGNLVRTALELLRPGGTLVISAITLDRFPELDYARHVWNEKTIRSVANVTRRDVRDALEEARRLRVRVEVESIPMRRANEALLRLKRRQVRGAAVLIP